MKNTKSEWDASSRILRTDLIGVVTTEDVRVWRENLQCELAKIPDMTDFRLLLNLSGFEPASLDAHKAMRTVIPEILVNHGMRPAFVDLFDEQPAFEIKTLRGIRCTAFANVHHDDKKMTSYERRIGKVDQKFFTDLALAESWLSVTG